jgi:hypothetical protein
MRQWFEQRPVQVRRVSSLTIHPFIKDMPRLAADDPRYKAMRAAWSETGAIPPLFTTTTGAIVDGRHRFWYCQDMRIETVVVVEVREDEVPLVVLNGLAGRNHISKGQRAYLAAPFLGLAFEASRRRHKEVRVANGKPELAPAATVEALAEKIGVSESFLWLARQLHEVFAKDAALRNEIEPLILADENPLGLGAAAARVAPRKAPAAGLNHKNPPGETAELRRFQRAWTGFVQTSALWRDSHRRAAAEMFEKTLHTMPGCVLELMSEGIERARRAKTAGAEAAPAGEDSSAMSVAA